jgi:hypothetical protein
MLFDLGICPRPRWLYAQKVGAQTCKAEPKGTAVASTNASNRGIWTAIILLAALVIGGAAGVSFHACGGDLSAAVQMGGEAILGLAALGMAIYNFITG